MMELSCFAAMLSAIIMASTFNAVHGSLSVPFAKAENAPIDTDTIKESKEKTSKFFENFNKWIDKHNSDIDKYRDLHPDMDYNKDLSQRIKEMIQEHIKKAAQGHIKDNIGEVINSAISLASERHDSRSGSESGETAGHSADNEVHDGSSCQDIDESEFNSQDKSDNSRSEKREDHVKFNSLMHDIIDMVKDLRSKITDKIITNIKFVKSRVHAKLDILQETLKRFSLADDDDDSSDENYSKDSDESSSSKSDEIRSEDINKVIENEIDRTTEVQNVTATDVHHILIDRVKEIFGPDIKSLKSSKQAFINSKAEMIIAANKLHTSSSTNNKPFRGHTNGRTFDFQALTAFKSKLSGLITKKKQYIKEKVLLKERIKELLSKRFLTYSNKISSFALLNSSNELRNSLQHFPSVTSEYYALTTEQTKKSDRDDGFKITTDYININGESLQYYGNRTEQTDNSSNLSINISDRDGLKLAAGNTGANDESKDGNNSTVVVVVVLACLVISAVICVLGLVMWRKYHRQRLYVRIPNGFSAPTNEQNTRSIW